MVLGVIHEPHRLGGPGLLLHAFDHLQALGLHRYKDTGNKHALLLTEYRNIISIKCSKYDFNVSQ